MNIELMEHLELDGKKEAKTIMTIQIDFDGNALERLSCEVKDYFFDYARTEINRSVGNLQRDLNIFLYHLRHPKE